MNTIAFFACINSIVIMVIIIIFWYTYIEDSQSFPIRFLAGSCLGGIVVALIWVVNTDISIHATIMATFVWPYAAGYAWASVISRARSRRRLSGAILQAIVITILMATALILVIDATPALVTNLNNTLNINFIIVKVLVNGYIIITCSGLVIDIFIFAILIRETIYAVRKIQQENSEFQENSDKKT